MHLASFRGQESGSSEVVSMQAAGVARIIDFRSTDTCSMRPRDGRNRKGYPRTPPDLRRTSKTNSPEGDASRNPGVVSSCDGLRRSQGQKHPPAYQVRHGQEPSETRPGELPRGRAGSATRGWFGKGGETKGGGERVPPCPAFPNLDVPPARHARPRPALTRGYVPKAGSNKLILARR